MANNLVLNAYEASDRNKGLFIEFFSDDSCHIDDIFSLNYDKKERYFKVISVRSAVDRLYIIAREYGYYDIMFRRVDVRNLNSRKVTKVVDKEIIQKINRESCYL